MRTPVHSLGIATILSLSLGGCGSGEPVETGAPGSEDTGGIDTDDCVPCSGDHVVENSVDLEDLSLCESVEGDVEIISGGTWLKELKLPCLESVGGSFHLAGASTLWSDWWEMPRFDSVGGDLLVSGNPDLTDLSGLAALEGVGGDLSITYNDDMTSLDGPTALGVVGGTLVIDNNWSLTSIDGLVVAGGIVGNLEITNNSHLCQSDALDFAESLSVLGGAEISGNADC